VVVITNARAALACVRRPRLDLRATVVGQFYNAGICWVMQ
jgi:hypothetical protein